MATDLIPFGKYKGQSIAAVMASDPGYVEWLTAQDWFAQKYRPIYNIMVQATPDNSCTPEHNRIQVQFLEPTFRRAFFKAILPEAEAGFRKSSLQKVRWGESGCCYPEYKFNWTEEAGERPYSMTHSVELDAGSILEQLSTRKRWKPNYWLGLRSTLPAMWATRNKQLPVARILRQAPVQFELPDARMEYLADVAFKVELGLSGYRRDFRFAVEIKPSLGDDYPNVLRQIDGQKHRAAGKDIQWVLLYDTFTAEGASEEQVRAVFEQAGVRVARLADVKAALEVLAVTSQSESGRNAGGSREEIQ